MFETTIFAKLVLTKITSLKDALKAFDDFKNKQQKCIK